VIDATPISEHPMETISIEGYISGHHPNRLSMREITLVIWHNTYKGQSGKKSLMQYTKFSYILLET
jgi:hypothetical protein